MPLSGFRHVRDIDRPPHEGRPRLLGKRLHRDELPELSFRHDDLGYAVVQDPVLQRGETGLLAFREHGIGYGLSHQPASFPAWVRCFLLLLRTPPPGWPVKKRRSRGRRKGFRQQYTSVLNES